MSSPSTSASPQPQPGKRGAPVYALSIERGRACLRCRERKVKCDGLDPCTPCVQLRSRKRLTEDQWPCEKENLPEGAKRSRVSRKQVESLEQRAAELQARYDELLSESLPEPPSYPAPHQDTFQPDPFNAPELDVLAAAVDQLSQGLHDPYRAGPDDEARFTFGETREQQPYGEGETVCDPLTALVFPDWPRSLPPASMTIAAVRDFFRSAHPAIRTVPRSILAGIALPPTHKNFPNVGLVHIILSCTLMYRPAKFAKSLLEQSGMPEYWGKGEKPHHWHMERAREVFRRQDIASLSPAHMRQELVGRTILLYLDFLTGRQSPWLDVSICARLAHMLSFDHIPPPFTPSDDPRWGVLGPPEDDDERVRRQAVWLSLLGADRFIAVNTGFPQAIPFDNATTAIPFPSPETAATDMDEYHMGLVEASPSFYGTHPMSDPPFAGVQALGYKTNKLLADVAALERRAPLPYGSNEAFVRPHLASIREQWFRLRQQLDTLDMTLPDALLRGHGNRVFTNTFLRIAHSNRHAARIVLFDMVSTARPDDASLASCVKAANKMLEYVAPWPDTTVIKETLACLFPTWGVAARTFACQAAVLRSRGQDAAAPLESLERIRACIATYADSPVAVPASALMRSITPYLDGDEATCMPSCTEEDVAALMGSISDTKSSLKRSGAPLDDVANGKKKVKVESLNIEI